MRTFARVLLAMLFVVVALVAAGAVVLYAGVFNTSATMGVGSVERFLAITAVNASTSRRAPTMTNPLLVTPEVMNAGLDHYASNCIGCHGAPGVERAEMGRGLNPPAPELTAPWMKKKSDGELYWMIGQGIRMSGMPAFSRTLEDRELWELVAFVRHLPDVTPVEQNRLQMAVSCADHAPEPLDTTASSEPLPAH